MQIDMHYFGTYALALAAGLNDGIAKRIAEAAQLVDDYTEERDLETSDGALISYWPSGHGMTIKRVVALEGRKEKRASGWREAARNGSLGFVAEIPEYPEGSLQAELEGLSEVTADQVASQRVWRFTRGVEVMRGFILNDLLPRHGLIG